MKILFTFFTAQELKCRGRSEVSTSVVKWSEGLSNRVSIIIRRYTGYMKFAASFIFVRFCCVALYIWLYVLYVSV